MDIRSLLYCPEIFTQMPRTKKASTRAKVQRGDQTTFGSTKLNSAESDNLSEYDPSDNDETLSEDEEGGTLDYITAMQKLYAVFLPMHLKPQVKSNEHENGVSCLNILGIQHCCDRLHQKVKRQKSSNPNRSVVYRGDSRTSQWRQKKEWKKAAEGTMKLDGFLVVSCSSDQAEKVFTSAICSRNGHVHHLQTCL